MKSWKTGLLISTLLMSMLLTGCGQTIRENFQPIYQLKVGDQLFYKLALKMDLAVEASAIFKYNGRIEVSLDMEMRAVDYVEGLGMKVYLLFRNPLAVCGDRRIASEVIRTVNNLQNIVAVIYIKPDGEISVLSEGKVQEEIGLFLNLLFPDFKYMQDVRSSVLEPNSFHARYDDKDITVFVRRTRHIGYFDSQRFLLNSTLTSDTYDDEEYKKSVEPVPMGTVSAEMEDDFDYVAGKLTSKKGSGRVSFSIPMKRGVLYINFTVEANGRFEMKLTDGPKQ